MAKDGKKAGRGKAGSVTLERSPSQLLHRALQRALDIYAEEAPPEGATQRQYAVLSATAENEGASQSELVGLTGIDRSTLADLVTRLAARQLIARERSPLDNRANTLRLTDEGRAALAAAHLGAEAADRRLLALLPKSRREGFLGLLAVIADPASKSAKARKRDGKAAKAAKPAKAAKGKKKSGKKGAAGPVPSSDPTRERPKA